MSTIVLLEMQVKPEAVDEMKAFLKKALPDTRAYDGCQGLDLYGNLDNAGNLVAYHSILKFFQVDSTGMLRMTLSARYFRDGVGSSRPS
jgi:hypothetical protein